MEREPRVLVLDEPCRRALEQSGLRTSRELNGDYDVAVLDLEDRGLIAEIRGRQPWIQIILIAAPSLEDAKAAVRSGADFLEKPVQPMAVFRAVMDALERREWTLYREPAAGPCWFREGSVGISPRLIESIGAPIFVELPLPGTELAAADPVCKLIDAARKVHVLPSPVAGRVVRVNEALLEHPEGLLGNPWILKLERSAVERVSTRGE